MQSSFRTRRKQHEIATVIAVAVTATTALPAASLAVVIDWKSTAATSVWATGSNWVGEAAPANNATDTARFNQTSYANQPNTGPSRTIGGVMIGDGTTATAELTIGGTLLAIGFGGAGTGVTMNANARAATFATSVSLGANQSWTNNSTSLLTLGDVNLVNRGLTVTGSGNTVIGGTITATTGTLTKSGAGTLKLGASNSYTGTTTVSGGTLDLNGNSQSLGRVVNDATITNSSATPATLTFTNNSTGAGSFTGNMNIVWNGAASNGTITGGFQNTGSVTLNANGVGNLTLSTAAANNTGTITNSGTSTGTTTIVKVGGNVTGVVQDSATSVLRLGLGGGSGSGSPDWSSGLSIKRGIVEIAGFADAAGSATNPITLGDAAVGADAVLRTVGSTTVNGPITVAAGGGARTIGTVTGAPNPQFASHITLQNNVTLQNDANSNGGLTFSGGISGTGNVTLKGNSTLQSINLTTGTINNVGAVTNFGTGSMTTLIAAPIGTNVTGVVQASAASALVLTGSHTYTAPTTVTAGTLQLGRVVNIDVNTTQIEGGSLANGKIDVNGGATFSMIDASSLTMNVADATVFDQMNNAGTVNLAGTIYLNVVQALADDTYLDLLMGSGMYNSAVSSVIAIGAYDGSLSGDGPVFTGTFGDQSLAFNTQTGDLSVSAVAVPEPSALASVAVTIAGLLCGRRQRE